MTMDRPTLEAALSEQLDQARAVAGAIVLIAVARYLKRIGRDDLMLNVVMGDWLGDSTGEASQRICEASLDRMEKFLLDFDRKRSAS